jgi:hypothetical protein
LIFVPPESYPDPGLPAVRFNGLNYPAFSSSREDMLRGKPPLWVFLAWLKRLLPQALPRQVFAPEYLTFAKIRGSIGNAGLIGSCFYGLA